MEIVPENEGRIFYDVGSVILFGQGIRSTMGFDKDNFPGKPRNLTAEPDRPGCEVIVQRPNKPVAHTITPFD
jgi:hypothetical protein